MALIEVQVKFAKTNPKHARKLFDAHGLYIFLAPTGSKLWRWKYRFQGREKTLSFGPHPEVSLKEAREQRNDARRLLREGRDPSAERKVAKRPASPVAPDDTFEAFAKAWLATRAPGWVPSYVSTVETRLERYILPALGKRAVGSIKAPEILEVLRAIEKSGKIVTAHRVREIIGQVIRSAAAIGKAESDPTALLRNELRAAPEVKPQASIIDGLPHLSQKEAAVGKLMQDIEGYKSLVLRSAMKMHLLTLLRSWELRGAQWKEIDLKAATWIVPAERMKAERKKKRPHTVPLSRQAVEVLRELRCVTGDGPYVFPGGRGQVRPLSENAVVVALRSMDYFEMIKDEDGKPKTVSTMTAHGFRSLGSTLLNELGKHRSDVIERQLAHSQETVRGAYDRSTLLAERRRMMQDWADYLDEFSEHKTARATSSRGTRKGMRALMIGSANETRAS